MSEWMPDGIPERMPDRMSEYMPDRMSDRMSEYIYILYMPHILPDGISEAMSEYRVTVGITRSKVIFVSYVTYVPPFQRLLMFPGKI